MKPGNVYKIRNLIQQLMIYYEKSTVLPLVKLQLR